jgi:hypothetical protein
VADEQHCPPLLTHVAHLPKTFLLNGGVAHREHLVDDEDLRIEVRRAPRKASRMYMPLE